MEKNKKYWTIKRYVIEYFEVEAISKKEAFENVGNGCCPHRIELIKETAKISKKQ